MANDFSGSQWYVDTPYNAASIPAGDIRASVVFPRSINWAGMAANATLQITDINGKILFALTAANANQMFNLPSLGPVRGFAVPTMTSGTLQVSVNK